MSTLEVQSLSKQRPIDIAIVSSKSYDTEWSTVMIRPYLSTDGFVVSAQNSINEETIARVVGWGRTVGCVVGNNFGVDLFEPGCLHALTVTQTNSNHPSATPAQQTGRYWTITPYPAGCTSGYSAS